MSRPRKYAFSDSVLVVAVFDLVGVGLIWLGNRWWRSVDQGLAEFGDADDTRRGVSS